MTTTQVNNAITLSGSSEMVAEFFEFSVNSILYQRGVYPPEKFSRVQKYGMTVLVTDDQDLRTYLEGITKQLKELLLKKLLDKLVLVIANSELKTPIERWEFNIHADPDVVDDTVKKEKSTQVIQAEIASIIRQIVACVTFLPQLGGSLAFDLLIYTKKDATVNDTLWADSQPMLIEGGQTATATKGHGTHRLNSRVKLTAFRHRPSIEDTSTISRGALQVQVSTWPLGRPRRWQIEQPIARTMLGKRDYRLWQAVVERSCRRIAAIVQQFNSDDPVCIAILGRQVGDSTNRSAMALRGDIASRRSSSSSSNGISS